MALLERQRVRLPPPLSSIPEGTTLEQVRVEMLGLMAQQNTNHHRIDQVNLLAEALTAPRPPVG